MDKELFLGIPGVDVPYPKHVQDALDFIERESKQLRQRNNFMYSTMSTAMGTYPAPERLPRELTEAETAWYKRTRPRQ